MVECNIRMTLDSLMNGNLHNSFGIIAKKKIYSTFAIKTK